MNATARVKSVKSKHEWLAVQILQPEMEFTNALKANHLKYCDFLTKIGQ